jgi:hypothetical protein
MLLALVSLLLSAEPASEISILLDGRFHAADVPDPGTGWFSKDGNKLVPVKLKVTKAEVLEGGKRLAMKDISADKPGIFYVKGLEPGPVKLADLRRMRSLDRNDVVKADDATLQGFTEGKVHRVVLTQGGQTQTIYEQNGGGREGWSVHWAGDLDGDGKLDFVLDADQRYEIHTTRLFLSSRAQAGELVREVAKFTAKRW